MALHNLLSPTQIHHFHTSHAWLISMAWKFTAPLNYGEVKKILKPASVHLHHFIIMFTKQQENCAWTHYSLLKIWGCTKYTRGSISSEVQCENISRYCWNTFFQLCWKRYSTLRDCDTVCVSPVKTVKNNNWFSWKLVCIPLNNTQTHSYWFPVIINNNNNIAHSSMWTSIFENKQLLLKLKFVSPCIIIQFQ
jgi:hypothetical protein